MAMFGLFSVLGYALLITVASNLVSNEVEKTQNSYEKHIGETYVLEGDTLKVIDYSVINGTYTLSNGVEINKVLIEK